MRLSGALPCIALILSATTATALSCAPLPAADGPIGYRERSGPDRCEGLYQSPVTGETIELLSYTRGRIEFDPRTDRTLTITAPDTTALGATNVAIVARALPLRVYYRMDANLTSGAALQFPLTDVIIPAGLTSASLGLLGSIQIAGRAVFVPLIARAEGPATPAAASPRPSTITFRAPTDLETFQWRFYSASGPPPAWKTFGGSEHTVRAGDPIPLVLDTTAAGVGNIEVAAKPIGGDYIRTRLQILVP